MLVGAALVNALFRVGCECARANEPSYGAPGLLASVSGPTTRPGLSVDPPRCQCSRTLATTPAWSDAQNGGAAWNGALPTTLEDSGRTAPWVITKSIRLVNAETVLVNVEFWQHVRPA